MFTPEEFKELKQTIDGITTHLPDNHGMLSYIWNNYKRISGDNAPQPCSCASAGKYWKVAVDTIRSYVYDNINAYTE